MTTSCPCELVKHYAAYTKAPRGDMQPQCQCCGGAILYRGYDASRTFAARLERACGCREPEYPTYVWAHRTWCPRSVPPPPPEALQYLSDRYRV